MHVRTALVVGAAALLLVGCSAGAENSPAMAPAETAQQQGGPAQPGGASDRQKAIVADGLVTLDERNEAFRAFAACLDAEGLTLQDTSDVRAPATSYRAQAKPGADPARTDAAFVRCRDEHFHLVAARWDFQNRPDPARLADAQKALATCMRSRGIDLPAQPTMADYLAILERRDAATEAYQGCTREVGEAYNLPGFAG